MLPTIKKYFGIRFGARLSDKLFFRVSHPAFHTLLFLPISLLFFTYAYWHSRFQLTFIFFLVLIGFFILQLSDYSIHRFEHYVARKKHWKFISQFHMIHHQYPKDVYLMQIPPVISLMISASLFSILYLVTQKLYAVLLISASYNFFYIIYEWMHYSAHCFQPQSTWLKRLQDHHLAHHYKNPQGYFGTTNRILDRLFKS